MISAFLNRGVRPGVARSLLALSIAATAMGCEDVADPDGAPDSAVEVPDSGAAPVDAGVRDTGVYTAPEAGTSIPDASTPLDGAADASTPDAAVDGGPSATSLCKLKGSELALVGDSYINLTSFASVLASVARKNGALAVGDNYIDHSLSGASMDGFPSIPAQWPDAVADAKGRGSKIRLAIMTGGGNDVLVNNRPCLDFKTAADISQQCKTVVDKAIMRGQEMLDKAVADKLEHVIYFFYPHLPKGGIGGGPYPNTILDYALPKVRDFCESQTQIPCTFVDLVPAFDDGTGFAKPGLINIDGIHPTGTGTELMADVIWKVMKDNCLGSEKL